MEREKEQSEDFATVEKAILWLAERYTEQPSLEELADWLDMSPFALQKLFSRWAGVSP